MATSIRFHTDTLADLCAISSGRAKACAKQLAPLVLVAIGIRLATLCWVRFAYTQIAIIARQATALTVRYALHGAEHGFAVVAHRAVCVFVAFARFRSHRHALFNARPALGTRDAVWTNRDALKSLWAAVATVVGHAFPKAKVGAPVHWVAKPCAPDFAPLAWLAVLVRFAALARCWNTDPKVTFIARG